jgi:anti-sigma-K factor RskA
MTTDTFEYFDGAYVLGALSPEERAAFEEHLFDCAACAARVAELQGLPELLSGISPDDLAVNDPGPVPDTMLPRLVREVRATHRRRGIFATAGILAAACVAALIAFFATSTSPSAPPAQALKQVIPTPVHATVALTAKEWGTQITLNCRYDESPGAGRDYKMDVVGRDGNARVLGGWRIRGGQEVTYVAGTSLREQQITKIEVTTDSGVPILRLRT